MASFLGFYSAITTADIGVIVLPFKLSFKTYVSFMMGVVLRIIKNA